MNGASVCKLIKAGYIFLRKDAGGGSQGDQPKIKYCNKFGAWSTMELFKSKAARDRKFKELIADEHSMYISDM
jgi:hypothetical protein